jgi:hypothetical protein
MTSINHERYFSAVEPVLADLGNIDPTLGSVLADAVFRLDDDGNLDLRRAEILTAALRVATQVAEQRDRPGRPLICLWCISVVRGGAVICEPCDLHGATLTTPPVG